MKIDINNLTAYQEDHRIEAKAANYFGQKGIVMFDICKSELDTQPEYQITYAPARTKPLK